MRLLLASGIYAHIALWTLSCVAATPVDPQSKGADDYPLGNGVSITPDDGNSIALVASDTALASLTSVDSSLTRRGSPPTYQDFANFFLAKQGALDSKLVFWSGVGVSESQQFAKAVGRQTLEMVIGDTWKTYQGVSADGGYWDDWPDAIEGFWGPLALACAKYATGEVFFYGSRSVTEDQTRPHCPKCWVRREKPALLIALGSHEVTRIAKYLYPFSQYPEPIGNIETVSD